MNKFKKLVSLGVSCASISFCVGLVPQITLAASNTIVVAKDGSGDYKKVQDAVNAIPDNSSSTTKLYIKKGTYKEVVTIPSKKKNVEIVGDGAGKTILTYNNYNAKSNGNGGTYGTGGSASVFIKGSNITVEGVTFENSFVEKGNSGEQAVALNVTGNQVAFNDCSFIGNQDTLLTDGGTQYFYDCYIEGDVDFIFGKSQAVFENCEIHSLDKGKSTNGYVTAARTLASDDYGFLFLNCDLTAESGIKNNSVYLGRPWCPSGTSTNKPAVVYKNCSMDSHIKTEGWTSMSGVAASHGRFYEYQSTGAGAVINSSRPQLSSSQAKNYTKSNVLDGWNPSF